jgi:hypothetical protein
VIVLWYVTHLVSIVPSLILAQIAAHIRHSITLTSVAEAQANSEHTISEGHSRQDAALRAIAASQTRHDQILPTLLSDADRGMSSRRGFSCNMLIHVHRGFEVVISCIFRSSRLEDGTIRLSRRHT